jgi:hypothetical protein
VDEKTATALANQLARLIGEPPAASRDVWTDWLTGRALGNEQEREWSFPDVNEKHSIGLVSAKGVRLFTASDDGTIETEYLGPLYGGRYVETWRNVDRYNGTFAFGLRFTYEDLTLAYDCNGPLGEVEAKLAGLPRDLLRGWAVTPVAYQFRTKTSENPSAQLRERAPDSP